MAQASISRPHVLIIGAGLGGLALAQSLRKQNISFDIFERDASDDARSQGWAISLHPWFIDQLLTATSEDMPDLDPVSTSYSSGIRSEGAIYDARSMTETTRFGVGENDRFIRADRAKLRDWLQFNLDSHMHWGKRFTHYEEDEQGVIAYFEDGTSYRGDVLVGADGINSPVRSQLLKDEPDARPKLVPHGIVVGEFTATQEQYRQWMKIASSFFIGFGGPGRIFVGLKGMNPDGKTARYYWFCNWPDENAANEDFWTKDASQQELHDFAMNNMLEGIHPTFQEVLQSTPVEGMLHPPLRLRDMPPPVLPKGRVTLLGDAVHPMTPFRGEGGNMAMKDGFVLASCLAETNGKALVEILKEYESEMSERTTKSVLASRAQGQ